MQTPSRPANEACRLEAVRAYEILDTAPEPSFDELALLAAEICEAPIGLITLVDADRQWFKSRVGVTAAHTPRDISFCGHAILHDCLLEVSDARADWRFHDNPLVTGEPGIRFYAGAPLVTLQGFRLGTLCVIDRVPRMLSPRQRTALIGLARQVVRQMDARSQALALQRQARLPSPLAECDAFLQTVIETLKEADRELRHSARTDALTALPNRARFVEALVAALARSRRMDDSVALLFLDIDRFRAVNDAVGPAGGDAILQEFGTRLRAAVRATDTVAPTAGDEFVIVLEGLHSAEDAELVTRKILSALALPWHLDGMAEPPSVSVGVAFDRTRTHCAADLIGYADELLYVAKTAGGNTFRITAC